MMTPPPDVELARLLQRLFVVDELWLFLRSYYREVADFLPENLGLAPLAAAAAEALARRNLIDDALFDRLRASRVRCTPAIDATARAYRRAAVAPAPRKRVGMWVVTAASGVTVVTAIVLGRPVLDSAECAKPRSCGEPPGIDEPARALSCPPGMALIDRAGAGPVCLDRTEVTRGSFCAAVTARPSDKYAATRCEVDAKVERWHEHPIAHVRVHEAAAYCAERGLRLPERREYVEILRRELDGRALAGLLQAANLCGAECHAHFKPGEVDFHHRDAHERAAPVGSYRERFASPQGLDDMLGNVREIVRDGELAFACGSGWSHASLRDLKPENCLDPQNQALTAGTSSQALGFRCAGAPLPVES